MNQTCCEKCRFSKLVHFRTPDQNGFSACGCSSYINSCKESSCICHQLPESRYKTCPTGACPKVPHDGNCGCKCHQVQEVTMTVEEHQNIPTLKDAKLKEECLAPESKEECEHDWNLCNPWAYKCSLCGEFELSKSPQPDSPDKWELELDKWIEVTGILTPKTSYEYELKSFIRELLASQKSDYEKKIKEYISEWKEPEFTHERHEALIDFTSDTFKKILTLLK